MKQAIGDYFRALIERFGSGWNRFWFTPSDPFALAVIRIGTGLMALYMVATFGPDLGRFFGRAGLLPATTLEELGTPAAGFSYLNLLHTPAELTIGHVAGLTVLALFTIGLFSRVTSVLALIVVLSYIHRGPLLAGQFEPILALVLAYLCLGPSGRCLSVDSLLARRRKQFSALPEGPPRSTAATVAIRLMQVHLSAVYLMMALAKLSGGSFGNVWWTGDAMWWLIAKPESRTIDLTWLPEYVVNAWTHVVVWFELLFPVLIWNRLARPLLLVVGVAVWASLAVATGLVPFCLMMLVGNLAFVSPAVLRAVLRCQVAHPANPHQPSHRGSENQPPPIDAPCIRPAA